MTQRKQRRTRGCSLVWATVSLTAFIGMASIAVDVGRVQLAKTEMRRAADAAARAGANALDVSNAQAGADALA